MIDFFAINHIICTHFVTNSLVIIVVLINDIITHCRDDGRHGNVAMMMVVMAICDDVRLWQNEAWHFHGVNFVYGDMIVWFTNSVVINNVTMFFIPIICEL